MQNDFKPSKRPVKNAEICSICRIIIQKAADKRLVIIINIICFGALQCKCEKLLTFKPGL